MELPQTLRNLITNGSWPTQASNTCPNLGPNSAFRLTQEHGLDGIYLIPPPFPTLAAEAKSNPQFWLESLTNIGEIDYSRSLLIGDFGLGSDSVIILNYEQGDEPRVMYLKWSITPNGQQWDVHHSWVCTHLTFDTFAHDVNLR